MTELNRFPNFQPDCDHPDRLHFLAAQDQGIAQWCRDCGALCVGANQKWQWANRPAKVAAARKQRDWAIGQLERCGEDVRDYGQKLEGAVEKYDAVIKKICKQRDDAIEAEKKASHEARSLSIRLSTAKRACEVFRIERDEAKARVSTMNAETDERGNTPETPKSLSSDRLHALAEKIKRRLEFALCVQDGATRIKHSMREDERAMFDKLLMSLVHNA